jgi:16S rRNA (cytosine967-C5)-methyltransferase
MRINQFLKNGLEGIIAGFSFKDRADLYLNAVFKKNRFGKRDRLWMRDRFYFYIRHKLLFDKLKELGRPLAESIAMMFDNEPDNELSEVLLKLKDSGEYEVIFNRSFPPFLADRIKELYGTEAFEWFNSKAETVIRTNFIKISREKLITELLKENVEAVPSQISTAGIMVGQNSSNLKESELFKKGLFEFQDESSQLSSMLINAKSGRMLDFCAGGGGKTLAAGSFFKGIRITVSDVRVHMLEEIGSRCERAGMKVSVKKPFPGDFFDTVLTDVPCSGSGVLRRNPADRWNIDKKMISELNLIQSDILEKAKEFVPAGGELIYVTCSFLEEENEQIVSKFLSRNSDFQIVPALERLKENIPDLSDAESITKGNYFRISPGHQRDIMFGVILKRNN